MATTWVMDPMHSEIQFKVRHLVISNVTGSFKKFSGTAVSDSDNIEDAKVNVTVDITSIDTNQADRDAHLRTNDFFNAEAYPEMTFESTSLTKLSGDNYTLRGNLTIRGITKEVELGVEFGGSETDLYGNKKYGFEVTGSINRKDFGISFGAITETGGVVVGDTVKIMANVQFAQQA